GLQTAAMFWVGTEAPVAGVRPTRWSQFDAEVPAYERVDRVLGWLSEPPSTRPRLVTLYFEHLDSAGHRHGPHAPETRETLQRMDRAIGRLVDGLADRGMADQVDLIVVSDHGMAEVPPGRVSGAEGMGGPDPGPRQTLQRRDRAIGRLVDGLADRGMADQVDLIVVSDHGMAEVPPGQVIAVEDMVDPDHVELVSAGQSVGFAPHPGHEGAAEARLLGRHERYECWRRGELPARWDYGSHPRVPPIVCQMDEGWDALPREYAARAASRTRGSHGFDPALPSMRTIFIADGPSFADGAV